MAARARSPAGAQDVRRVAARAHDELECVRVPAGGEVAHKRQSDVVSGEVPHVISADLATLRIGHRDPRGEEDDRPDDREEHPEDRLDPVLRRRLNLRDQKRPIRADHALTVVCSDVKTRSMTSSIGGSSTEMSARRSRRSLTRRAVRSGATCRSTRKVTRPSPRETTVPYASRSVVEAAPSCNVAVVTLYRPMP